MTPLADLPRPSEKRLAIRVTKDALRQVRHGHPWVFDGSIESVSHEGAPGDLGVVFDDKRKFAAIGLWDPESPIQLRVLHAGRPVQITEEFWRSRIEAAWDRREPLRRNDMTTGHRVLNGENDGFPGLVVDRYGDHLVMKVYSHAWFPHLAAVRDALVAVAAPAGIILRLGRHAAESAEAAGFVLDGVAVVGEVPTEPVRFTEAGLQFQADLIDGQKTGHFLDQRDNRVMVGRASHGARVLDVFSCTGGFSVHAAAAGAKSVHLVDQSPHAIKNAMANLDLNNARATVAACERSSTVGDAFEAMTDLAAEGRRFEVVVVDPPSFAQRERNVPAALNSYRRLAELSAALVSDGGLLVSASCSSRVGSEELERAVLDGSRAAGVELDDRRRTGHALDHPITFPEGGYLNAIFSRVRR